MESEDLKEIKAYWEDKYPNIHIVLFPKLENGKFGGKMMSHDSTFDLMADTIGELISQGESFLRSRR